ncbi:MAG: peptidoglycan bridge formation glycyltransferase FemA/FemB family protein, partial [Microgenomates group bacterium]
MIFRQVRTEEKELYNRAVSHPLQSWEWGEFRKKTGVHVERIGLFNDGAITKGLQVTFHPIPLISKTAGYLPKGYMPDEDQLSAIKELGKKQNALFIKLEPNVAQKVGTPSAHDHIR